MVDIQFDEGQGYQQPIGRAEQKPLFIRLVLATNLVSSDAAAKYVLFGMAVLLLALAFSIFVFMGSGPASPPPANQIIWVAGPGATPGKK